VRRSSMARAARIAVAVVALEHLWFMILEMFLWTKPLGTRTFGLTPVFAEASRVLAANQGLYNGFLAAGLEPISEMPQQDADASEVKEAEEVLGMALIAGDQTAVVLEPSEEPFDLPAPAIAPQGTTVLGPHSSTRLVGSDQLDPALTPQPLIQAVAVVGAVPDQSLGSAAEEAAVEGGFDERDLMRRST